MADSGIKEAFTSAKGSDDGERDSVGDEARFEGLVHTPAELTFYKRGHKA